MNKIQIKKELKKIDYELKVNRPKISPYSHNVVKRRTFLLFAQVHLINILDAKSRKDKWYEKFETEMYYKIMDKYYNWGKNE